jgi:hypothetical protein
MMWLMLRFAMMALPAWAQDCPDGKLCVNIGSPLSWGQLTKNIIDFLAASIGFVCVAIFIFGALKLTASAFNEEWRNQGKDLMIKSLVAMVIVLGAYAILRTVAFFLLA